MIEATNAEFPAAQLKLIHSGKILKDESTLEEYKIKENEFLVCMVTKVKSMTLPISDGLCGIFLSWRVVVKVCTVLLDIPRYIHADPCLSGTLGTLGHRVQIHPLINVDPAYLFRSSNFS